MRRLARISRTRCTRPYNEGVILRVLACAAVAACYAPHPPEGAPCTDSARCPSGQRCVAGFCSSADASPPPLDAPPIDSDGDGIVDSLDNCPTVANPGQENEDGDALGDACDPCPVDIDNTDSDGDGVGDACDPNPMMMGDRIVLFEGFHHGLPMGWTATTGAVTAAGDDATITAAAATPAWIAPPLAAPLDATLSASATIGTVDAPGMDDADFGIGLPYAVATGTDVGILCWLYQPPNAGTHRAALENHATHADLASAAFAWQTGTDYVFTLQRTATSYRCNVATPGMTTAPLTATAALSPANPLAVVRGYGTTTTVHWVMLVQSP